MKDLIKFQVIAIFVSVSDSERDSPPLPAHPRERIQLDFAVPSVDPQEGSPPRSESSRPPASLAPPVAGLVPESEVGGSDRRPQSPGLIGNHLLSGGRTRWSGQSGARPGTRPQRPQSWSQASGLGQRKVAAASQNWALALQARLGQVGKEGEEEVEQVLTQQEEPVVCSCCWLTT